jgi:AcrR family transcriptional regulator
MTPRSYDDHNRKRAADAGRDRILAAAREILNLDDLRSFSLDAVARGAGVTRMTVYNQFGSKSQLLAELFDTLVERDAFSKMPDVFKQPDVGEAFDSLVAILGRFYTDNRPLMVRMAGAAGLDPDLDEAMRSRNLRRRRVVETLVQRLGEDCQPAVAPAELVNTLDVLLNFTTFNGIAGPARTPKAVVPHMRRMIRSVLGLPATKAARPRRSPVAQGDARIDERRPVRRQQPRRHRDEQ